MGRSRVTRFVPEQPGRGAETALLPFALNQAEQQAEGFQDVVDAMLARQGMGVDHWEQPMVLLEEYNHDHIHRNQK
eukprot:5363402-Amphidinium_carterae.1